MKVKTAENEVPDRKWREEAACVGEEGRVGNRKRRQSCGKNHSMVRKQEPG